MADGVEVLTSAHVLEYPYSRSVGPVVGAFFTGLRDGKVLGVRGSGGRVIVPPTEYDPETGEEATELVEVGPQGTVTAWAWSPHPGPKQPLEGPFAWVLVKMDGADTSLLHVAEAPTADAVRTGMRVRPEFADLSERVGHLRDIRRFVAADKPAGAGGATGDAAAAEAGERGPVTVMAAPIRLDYTFTAGTAQTKNLLGLAEGRFVGQRCPKCRKVYVPSRGSCPTDGVATTEEVALPDTGTVTTYCVVNVPFAGQSIEIPYICAQILLDGADLSFMGLIQEIPATEVRMGLRVQAVWVDPDQLGPSMASVKYFKPTGEPDADYDSYKAYL